MIILKNYTVLKGKGVYYAVAEEPCLCPDCGGQLYVRDSRKRSVIEHDQQVRVFCLRRLQCKHCKKTHLELPDLMLPYKRYSHQVISQTVKGERDDCPADNTTIYRWKKSNS